MTHGRLEGLQNLSDTWMFRGSAKSWVTHGRLGLHKFGWRTLGGVHTFWGLIKNEVTHGHLGAHQKRGDTWTFRGS